jgi:2,3-bisphosphoglycerate-independent phosphoglycerate mutase
LHVLLLFVDGFGIGPAYATANPYVTAQTPTLDAWLSGKRMTLPPRRLDNAAVCVVPTDACLGVDGLPQSATGQTALLTGLNAPAAVGRHVNGFPTLQLRQMLDDANIMLRLRREGFRVALANAYSPEYFTLIETGKRRHAAIALAAIAAGVPFRSLEDLRAGHAVYQDVTSGLLLARGQAVPALTPETAGEYLARITRKNDFTLFEYFQTDLAGHSGNLPRAVELMETLDRFFGATAAHLTEDCLLVIASDHGNVEDMSVRTHTRNPVPTILYGAGREEAAGKISDLTDIAPALLALLRRHRPTDQSGN